jgi:acyl carrier protein
VSIEQELIGYISKQLARPDTKIEPETNLVGVVDSTAVMELVVYIADHYGFDVEIDAITPDNFGSVQRLADYIRKHSPKAKGA